MILNKDILQDGHKTLRNVASPVDFPLNKQTKNLAKEIMEYLENSQDENISAKYKLRAGVGLAAPQINQSIRMFGIFIPGFDDEDFKKIFINPKIISHSEEMCYLSTGEGCLSVDEETTGYVARYKRITVEAYDEHGENFTLRLANFKAIVFQHEYDHLNGILFTDKLIKDVSNLKAI